MKEKPWLTKKELFKTVFLGLIIAFILTLVNFITKGFGFWFMSRSGYNLNEIYPGFWFDYLATALTIFILICGIWVLIKVMAELSES